MEHAVDRGFMQDFGGWKSDGEGDDDASDGALPSRAWAIVGPSEKHGPEARPIACDQSRSIVR